LKPSVTESGPGTAVRRRSEGSFFVFASSAFVPTAGMPEAVQTVADINPVTLVVDAARSLTIGHGDALGPTLGTLAWLIGLLLTFVPLSVRAFRRA
jgi:ABC-type polysaccharide/polyol phosphate export permease